ncbi:MAG TPA: PQQ-binding-like beta-propeller repeat protein, partial [Acidimicrobiales bacterium]|nr:PQQ-binding-like beta-propeller repeat protein [Acidimicrobiales bacterium]
DDDNVYGISTTTHDIVWTGVTGGPVTSSPVIDAGGVAYVGSQDGKLYAFPDSCTGTCTPLWTATTGGPIESSPALHGGTVYVGSNDGKLYAFDKETGALEWTLTTGGAVVSSPAIANGVVYFGSSDDNVYAANAAGCGASTCSPLWTEATGGPVLSSPVVADGLVFVGSNDGLLHVYGLPATGGAQHGGLAVARTALAGVVRVAPQVLSSVGSPI